MNVIDIMDIPYIYVLVIFEDFLVEDTVHARPKCKLYKISQSWRFNRAYFQPLAGKIPRVWPVGSGKTHGHYSA